MTLKTIHMFVLLILNSSIISSFRFKRLNNHHSNFVNNIKLFSKYTSIEFNDPLPLLSTIKAVEDLRQKWRNNPQNSNRNYFPITSSDLVQLTGSFDTNTAQRELSALGYLIGAQLNVNDEGDLVYNLPSDKNIYNTVRNKNKLIQAKAIYQDKIVPFAFTSTKVVFGFYLLFSLALAAVAATAALSMGSSSSSSSSSSSKDNKNNNNNDRAFRSSININYFPNYFRLTDMYYWRPRESGSEVTFINSFFSFVFGDEDPNKDFKNKQLIYAINYIRSKDGIVFADELAPYLNPPLMSDDAKSQSMGGTSSEAAAAAVVVDESWMLDTLIKLGGKHFVTEDGDILYDFRDVITNKFASIPIEKNPTYLTESEVLFSEAEHSQNVLAFGLGVANIIGVSQINTIVTRRTLALAYPVLHNLLRTVYPSLVLYSIFYMAFPAFRALNIFKTNKNIRLRNQNRMRWSERLEKKTSIISRKLKAVKNLFAEKTERK